MPRIISAAASENAPPGLHIIKRRSTSTRASSALSLQRHISHQEPRHHQMASSQVLSINTNLPSPPTSDSDADEASKSINTHGAACKVLGSLRRSRLSSFTSESSSLPVSPPESGSDDVDAPPKSDENDARLGTLRRRRPLRFAFRDGPAEGTSPPLQSPGPATAKLGGLDTCPFPLQPLPILKATNPGSTDSERVQRVKRRCFSSGAQTQTPPATPDRFISYRSASQDATKNFRISKRASELSSSERLLRQDLAAPDPFDAPTSARVGRRQVSGTRISSTTQVVSRTVSGTNLLNPSVNAANLPGRQVSTGAVWNVGGSASTAPTGPMNSVPDGRGGFVGSGTNAPMHTSRFFERNSPEHDRGRMERRLAAALDIDQTTRVLSHSRSPERGRSSIRSAIGSTSRASCPPRRTTWENGQWVRSRSLSRRHTLHRQRVNVAKSPLLLASSDKSFKSFCSSRLRVCP